MDEDILLKMMNAKDAEALFNAIDQSRLYLRAFLPWVDDVKSVEDCLILIKKGFQIHAEQSGLMSGVFYKGKLVGAIGFNRFDWTNRIGYIGYWIGEEYQGKGIITKSVYALMEYAFMELKLNRLDIRTAPKNKKSQAIPERLGFLKEGKMREAEWLYDHYVDHLIYGLLKSDWLKQINLYNL